MKREVSKVLSGGNLAERRVTVFDFSGFLGIFLGASDCVFFVGV